MNIYNILLKNKLNKNGLNGEKARRDEANDYHAEENGSISSKRYYSEEGILHYSTVLFTLLIHRHPLKRYGDPARAPNLKPNAVLSY